MSGVRLGLGPILLALVFPAAALGAGAEAPAPLAEATAAYQRNASMGDRLGGRPVTAEQAAEAEQLRQEALAKARAWVETSPRSAEAHRLVGLVLCTAYRPVSVEAPPASQDAAPQTLTVLRRGGAEDCEEGLAELRAALRLVKTKLGYSLDYAQALAACGDTVAAQQQGALIWEQRATLSDDQRARCARLLAECARNRGQPQEEVKWLREVLKYDPSDAAAGERVVELLPALPGIAWVTYETGKALAAQTKKPMWLDFTAAWCGWCRKLEKEVFVDPDVLALSQQFVCIKVDGDQRGDLTTAFHVDGYPTAVFLDHTGRQVHRIVGFRPARAYLAELQRALPEK